MKKTLIALAALAATGAFAQSTVSIDGIMDAGYQSINYKGNTVNDIGGNGSSTSQINFRGSEDLGGGLKAEFRVETDWNIVSNAANTGTASKDTADATKAVNASSGTFGNGELRVGVAGGFGRVDMGAVNFNSLTTYGVGQPYGTAIGGGFRGVYVTDASATSAVRADNAIKYVSPSFAGFSVSLYNVTKNTQATKGNYSTTIGAYDHQGVQEIGLNYSNGPLNASYSQIAQDYADVQPAGGTTIGAATAHKTTVRTLGANYDFGKGIKAFFLSQQVGADTAGIVDRNFSSIAGSYTMGSHVITALVGSGTNGLNAGKTSTLSSVGYDYNLSKRTAVYARYERIGDDGGFIAAASTVDGTDSARTRTAVGLRHAF